MFWISFLFFFAFFCITYIINRCIDSWIHWFTDSYNYGCLTFTESQNPDSWIQYKIQIHGFFAYEWIVIQLACFSVSYFIFGLNGKRDFSAFPDVSDFRFRTDSDSAWMQDSEQRADSRADAGSEAEPNRTPTLRFASAVDKNTLSLAIFFQTHRDTNTTFPLEIYIFFGSIYRGIWATF